MMNAIHPDEWSRVSDARRKGFSGLWPVEDTYRIRNGIIEAASGKSPGQQYAPITHIELPNVLAKLYAGTDEEVLRFVGCYGLLGYFELASQGAEEPQRYGDPLPWVRQHALTVHLIMNLWRLVQDADEGGLQTELAKLGSPLVTIRFAEGAKIRRLPFTLGAERPEPWPFALARDIVSYLINRNLAGIGPVLSDVGPSLQLGFSFRSLIDVIYYQLAVAVTGQRMQRCAAKDCGGLFIQHDPRQRFCPLWRGVQGESPCSLRERQRALRERRSHQSTQKTVPHQHDRGKARLSQKGRQEQTEKLTQQRTLTKGECHRDTIKQTRYRRLPA
ncbi:MAG: CGNR zinc finger domain-containing protein [Nitrospira sp.]|nr:CGNR zinc finger domain-containing protein [Nitrospira sp.]